VTDWLTVAIRPWEVAPHPNSRRERLSARPAAALLVEARIEDYRRYAEADATLPPLGHSSASDDPDWRLVAAIGRYLVDDFDVAAELKELASASGTASRGVVARVLASLAYAAAGNPSMASSVLSQDWDSPDPLNFAFLGLHRGLREYEAGNRTEAIQTTDAAREALGPLAATGDLIAVQLMAIALSNLLNYDEYNTLRHERLYSMQALARLSSSANLPRRLAAAADELLVRMFEERSAHPLHPGRRWTAEDLVVAPLAANLVQAELKGEFGSIRSGRRHLGKALILDAGQGVPSVVSGLHLIRRSGDVRLIDRAAAMVHRDGPLGAASAEVARIVEAETWNPVDLQSTFSLARRLVDLCSDVQLSVLVERLLNLVDHAGRLRDPPERPGWSVGYEFMRLIAAIASASDGAIRDRLAGWILHRLEEPLEALEVTTLTSAIRAITWELVPSDLQQLALSNARHRTTGDLRPAMLHLLARLAAAESDEAHEALFDVVGGHFGTLEAAVLLDSQLDLENQWVQRILEITLSAAEQQRHQAEAGSYSVGSIDPLRLLAGVYLRWPDARLWEEVLQALSHPSPLAQKGGLFEMLAVGSTDIDLSSQEDLRQRLEGLLSHVEEDDREWVFFDALAAEGALLRLWMTTRPPIDQVLARLSSLAGRAGPAGRTLVAEIVGITPSPAPDLFTAMAMTLASDDAPAVRAEAGRSLSRLLPSLEGSLSVPVTRRVVELLSADGTLIPLSTIRGLSQDFPPAVVDVVRKMREEHPSRLVRRAAERALTHPDPAIP
jgi:hypothetical protein